MNSDMWRTLCDEIPPDATPVRLRADAQPSASRAMIRYLSVLIRTSLTSPRRCDSAHVRELREPASVGNWDRSAD